jgi:hypothetical protein
LPALPQTSFNQSKCTAERKKKKTHDNCNNNQIRVLQKHSSNYTIPPSDALDLSLLFPPASHRVRPFLQQKLDTPINNPSRKKALQKVLKQSCEALFSSQMIRLAYTLIMFKLINLR